MRLRFGLLALIATVVMVSMVTGGAVLAAGTYPLASSSSVIQDALDYLESEQAADGSIGSYTDSGWACIAIAAAGEDPNSWDQGGDSLVEYLRDNPDYASAFNLATAYARTILAAVVSGEDPSSFGTYTGGGVVNGDFVQAVKDLYNGTQFEDGFGSTDLVNDDVWAVRALLAAGESPNSSEMVGGLSFIAANQDANGGWSWAVPGHAWYATSPDDTATALLSLLKGGYAPDSSAVEAGLSYLKSEQNDTGGFVSYGYDNVSSTAWAVNAIAAARQNPAGSAWSSSPTPIEYLLGQQQSDGRFPFRDDLPDGYSELPVQNTAWAVEALVGAHYRAPSASAATVVGGVAERPEVAGLLLPWTALAAGGLVLLGWAVRRSRSSAR